MQDLSWVVPPPSYPEPQREADATLEWATPRFPGHKAGEVSLGHTQSQVLLSPSLQVPAVRGKGSMSPAPGRGRAAQTRTWLVQQAGAWLRMHLLRLQLHFSSAAPSQCLLLPPDLPADQSVHVLPCSLQAPSVRLAPYLAPAVPEQSGQSFPWLQQRTGRHAAPQQEVVVSSWARGLLQKIQANTLGDE